MLEVSYPAVLVLLPLALLPLRHVRDREIVYSWLQLIPADAWSRVAGVLLRLLGMGAIAAAVLGLAGLYRPEDTVERVGKGAHIVLLLDRSPSMDNAFVTPLDVRATLAADTSLESKGHVARRLLSQFAASRRDDLFGMVVFNSNPMRLLEFTQKPDIVQAAINAGNVGKGVGQTDIGRALIAALSYFENRPYTGSRIILLVSDGGDHIDQETQETITSLMKRHRVSLYWIYIRSLRSPGLLADKDLPPGAEAVPEHFLNKFFQSMGTPYRAYEAENPEALKRAIADVNKSESLPISFPDVLPRRDLSQSCYGLALLLGLLLFAAKLAEIRSWR